MYAAIPSSFSRASKYSCGRSPLKRLQWAHGSGMMSTLSLPRRRQRRGGRILQAGPDNYIAPNRTRSSKKRAKLRSLAISWGDRPSGLKCIRLLRMSLTSSRWSRNWSRSTFKSNRSQCSALPNNEWYPANVRSDAPLYGFSALGSFSRFLHFVQSEFAVDKAPEMTFNFTGQNEGHC